MTPQEAWNILNEVCSQVTANRQTHLRIIEALRVLEPKEQ